MMRLKLSSLGFAVACLGMPLTAFACFFLGRALMTLPEGNLCLGLTESADAVFLAWLMAASLSGISSRYTRLLSWTPMVYVGKISYGIYVYHLLLDPYFYSIWSRLGWNPVVSHFVEGILKSGTTIVIAAASWHWFEKPVLSLKERLAPDT